MHSTQLIWYNRIPEHSSALMKQGVAMKRAVFVVWIPKRQRRAQRWERRYEFINRIHIHDSITRLKAHARRKAQVRKRTIQPAAAFALTSAPVHGKSGYD